MTEPLKIEQTVQAGSKELGISITAPVARAAPVSLAQRLAAYDPERHGGEVMDVAPVGAERF